MAAKKRKSKIEEAIHVLGKIDDDKARRARKRLELAFNPRTEVLSRRFAPEDIEKWKLLAEAAKMNLTDWMKMKMDA